MLWTKIASALEGLQEGYSVMEGFQEHIIEDCSTLKS